MPRTPRITDSASPSSTRALIALGVLASLIALSISRPFDAVAAKSAVKCTIEGTKRSEALRGTKQADVICAYGGNDRIKARAGKDVVRGGAGNDRIRTGDGDDRLSGGGGTDRLSGQDDDDELDGGPGVDQLDGGDGRDQCDAADERDIIATNCVSAFSVRSVSFDPPAVDTTLVAQRVTMMVRMTKTRSWAPILRRIWIGEELIPDDPNFGNLAAPLNIGHLELVSGTVDDGTWSGTITLAQGSPPEGRALALLLYEGYLQPMTGELIDSWELISAYNLRRADLPDSVAEVG